MNERKTNHQLTGSRFHGHGMPYRVVQQDEYPQHPNHLFPKDQGIHDDEDGNHFHIGQKRERNLRHKQQRAKGTGQRDIPGFAREISSPP